MTKKIVLFAAVFAAALIVGGQYVVWWDYNPAGMSAAFYTEKMQHAIRVIGTPLFAAQLTTALSTVILTFLSRRDRPAFYLLIAACICFLTGVLHTVFGNIPLLNQIATWNISAPPSDWRAVADKWWWIHTSRFIVQAGGLSLLILVALDRRRTD